MGSGLSQLAKDRIHTCRSTGKIELNLQDCDLKTVPNSRIRKFKLLKKLIIARNLLQAIPPEIKFFGQLEELDASTNELQV
jgi:Leucine-rich repeat (LRR) protein